MVKDSVKKLFNPWNVMNKAHACPGEITPTSYFFLTLSHGRLEKTGMGRA